ncbi:NADK3 [Symbiodinium microadriaticum]|nr:NADK3 [Symbiodinium microadriaticum]
MGAEKKVDERRSRGALCSTTAQDVAEMLPLMLTGDVVPRSRSRLMCVVQSTHTETRLPPVLNDILIAHPIPAQVSRFRMTCFHDTKFYKHHESFYDHRAAPSDMKTLFTFNAWCSGMWICTATGSTAAMAAAGGQPMELRSKSLQYLVRENMKEYGQKTVKAAQGGIIASDQLMVLRWNSLHGRVFVDGSHMEFPLGLGDEIVINSHAPVLNIFDPPEDRLPVTPLAL